MVVLLIVLVLSDILERFPSLGRAGGISPQGLPLFYPGEFFKRVQVCTRRCTCYKGKENGKGFTLLLSLLRALEGLGCLCFVSPLCFCSLPSPGLGACTFVPPCLLPSWLGARFVVSFREAFCPSSRPLPPFPFPSSLDFCFSFRLSGLSSLPHPSPSFVASWFPFRSSILSPSSLHVPILPRLHPSLRLSLKATSFLHLFSLPFILAPSPSFQPLFPHRFPPLFSCLRAHSLTRHEACEGGSAPAARSLCGVRTRFLASVSRARQVRGRRGSEGVDGGE